MTPPNALKQLTKNPAWMYNPLSFVKYTMPRCAFLVFTEAGTRSKYGRKFAEYVLANDLGEITITPPSSNPNTRRRVTVFVWKLSRPNLDKHLKELHGDNKTSLGPGA